MNTDNRSDSLKIVLTGDLFYGAEFAGRLTDNASVPSNPFRHISSFLDDADLLLVIGSSLVVNPAAKLPLIAQRNGAPVAIINRTETRQDHLAKLRLEGSAGIVLPRAVSLALSQ